MLQILRSNYEPNILHEEIFALRHLQQSWASWKMQRRYADKIFHYTMTAMGELIEAIKFAYPIPYQRIDSLSATTHLIKHYTAVYRRMHWSSLAVCVSILRPETSAQRPDRTKVRNPELPTLMHALHRNLLTLSQCRSYVGTDTFFWSSAARSIILHHQLEN